MIASGTTTDQARLSGITINSRRLDSAFLMEVSGGTDLTSGSAPLISPLRTIVPADVFVSGSQVFATPLTTFALDIAVEIADANNDGDVTIEELLGDGEGASSAIDRAVTSLKASFGFGLLGDDLDIFTTSPIFDGSAGQIDTFNYRVALEAFSAIIVDLGDQGGSTNSRQLLIDLAADLSDGDINGSTPGRTLTALQGIADIRAVVTQNPNNLLVPGASTSIGDIKQLLILEAGSLSPNTVVDNSLTISSLRVVIPGLDSDGDGVIDSEDACPSNINEQINSDADAFCDGEDLFIFDSSEWADSDSDGVGNNGDMCDLDSGTNFTYGSVDSDGDGFCALLAADSYAINLGIDYDDGDAGINSVCFDDSVSEQDKVVFGCLADLDEDGIADISDNCIAVANFNGQNDDLDGDDLGDVCDPDIDGDGATNGVVTNGIPVDQNFPNGGDDDYPFDASISLNCGGYESTAGTCYVLTSFESENTLAPRADGAVDVVGGLVTTNGNVFTGAIDIHVAAAVTASNYAVNADYLADWVANVSADTLVISNVVCTENFTDPLGLGSTSGGVFQSCLSSGASNDLIPAGTLTATGPQTYRVSVELIGGDLLITYISNNSVSGKYYLTFEPQ